MDATSLYFFVRRLEDVTESIGPAVSFGKSTQGDMVCFISHGTLFVKATGDGLYQALALAEEEWKLLLAKQKESTNEQSNTHHPDDSNPPDPPGDMV